MKKRPARSITRREESSKQRTAREINQTNFILCGLRENLKTQHSNLIRLGLHNSAFKLSFALDNVTDAIELISQERKLK